MITCFKCGKILPGTLCPGEYVMCKECEEKWSSVKSTIDKDVLEGVSRMKEINTITVNGETFVLRKKGKWIKKETLRHIYFVCSKCKGKLSWEGRYCPYCGSEMETDNG